MGAMFRWIRELFTSEVSALGQRVVRAATIFDAARTPIFNIVGGKVKITSIVGLVTGAIDDPGAVTVLLDVNAQPMDSGAGDIDDAPAGTPLICDGDVTHPIAIVDAVAMNTPWIGLPGDIALTCGAPTSDPTHPGTIEWTIHYIPIDRGAVVQPA